MTANKKTDLDRARDKYLNHVAKRGLSPSSVTSYQRHIDRFIDFLSKRDRKKVDEIRPNDLVAFERQLAKDDFASVTCSQSKAIVSKWLRYLAHEGEVDTELFPASTGRRRKWSQDKIITALKKLHRQGVACTYPGLRKAGHGNLTNAACRYFGSLTAAREAAQL